MNDAFRHSFRFVILGAVSLVVGMVVPHAAQAQDFSGKPIRIIVPFAPGGNIDITARALAPGLGESLGTSIIVENKPGVSGTLGVLQAAKAQPDGHTLVLGSTGSITIAPAIYKQAGYDPIKDLITIGPIHSVPLVLTTALKTPASDFKQFLALAKARDGKVSVGSPGIGSTNHLTMELFSQLSGIKLTHIPYKGAGPALNDLVAGQIESMVDQTPPSIPHIKEGRIRAIAVTSLKRIPSLPDVPTFDELGLKGFETSTFTGLFGPAGMPKAAVDKLSAALKKALANATVRERFAQAGADVLELERDAFATYVATDFEKWIKVVKTAGITPE